MAKQGICFFSESVLTARIDEAGDGDRDVGDGPLDPLSPFPLPLPLRRPEALADRGWLAAEPGTATV